MALLLIVVYLTGVLPSLGQTLLESHAFRQTQTAYTAVLYAERGIDVLRPPLPVLGPPGVLPQEFPLFQAAGALVMQVGIPADLAMRLTGLASFVLAASLLYLLARKLLGDLGALVALAAFLFNAHAWLYGRASLIEYLATAGGLAFLYFVLRWEEESSAHHWALAFIGGTLAVLVKITTGAFYLLPAFFMRSPSGRWGFQRPSVWALTTVVMAIGLVWSSYAQGVRSETPASAFLALENQYGWFFGTISQRLDIAEWRVPIVAMLMLTGSGLIVWAPAAIKGGVRLTTQPAFALAAVALVAAAPLILFNLYAVHDYYFAAISPLVALSIGLGSKWLAENRQRRWARRTIVGLAGAWAATIIGLSGTWSLIYGTPDEEPRALAIANYIQTHSSPDEWVVVRGLGWNPTFLYYARRQGIAVPEPSGLQDTSGIDFDEILADPIFGPEITCDHAGQCSRTRK